MPRWLKRLLVVAVPPALLLVGAALLLMAWFPPERIAALVSEQVSSRTGRSFAIQGRLAYRLLPRLAVVAEDLVLGNAPWASRKEMLRVQRAALELELWPLLQGQVKVDSVELDGVDLLLETDRRGAGNWSAADEGRGPAAPPTEGKARRTIDVARIRLRDVQLAYRNGITGRHTQLELKEMQLERDGAGSRMQAEWVMARQRWQATGQGASLEQLLANQTDWPFALSLQSDGVHVAVTALLLRGGAPRAARMDVDASLDKAVALGPWVTDPAVVPLPIGLKGVLHLNAEFLKADPLQLVVAGQILGGSASLQAHDPWQVDANLTTESLDLRRLPPARASPDAGAGGASAPKRLFGDARFPMDALPRAVAKVDLRVGQLLLPAAPPLSALKAHMNLRPGSLAVEPLSFGVAGGQVKGSLALVTGSGKAPRVTLRIDADALSAEALARAAGAGNPVRGGRLDLKANLQMTGTTPHELAAGVDGDMLLSLAGMTLGDGATGIGPGLLPRLLRIVRPKGDATTSSTIECAVVRLPFKGGVAAVERSIAVETSDLAISATGRIDLRDETLALVFHPSARGALGVGSAQIASLVTAKGPILAPKVELDAKGAANMALSIGVAAATGGLSTIGKSLAGPVSDPHPCRYAATGVAAAAGTRPAGPAASGAKPVGPEDVRKLLRGLFK